MFDFDVGKLLIFGIVALAVIPPKDLPRVMRVVGQALGRMRRMAAEFQGQFMDAMREVELDSVKKELDSVKSDFANVQKELNAIEQSAKIDSSFDPAMAIHSEQSHAIEAPKDVGQSEVSLTGPTPDGGRAAAEASAPVAPPPGRRAGSRRAAAGRRRMTAEDIDATKAPLMDHLIELRMRLVRAIYAFLAAFLVCFYFSRTIYNVLTEPYVRVVGAEKATLIATHFLEQFYTNIRLSMFGAGVIAFPIIAVQIYKFVAPGLYKKERQAFLPYLIATPIFFAARRAARLFRRHAAADPLLGVAAAGQHAGRGDDRAAAQGQRIPVADHDADLRLRRGVPASGGADAARPGRHRQLGRICRRMRRYAIVAVTGDRGDPDPARPPQHGVAGRCRCCCSTRAR